MVFDEGEAHNKCEPGRSIEEVQQNHLNELWMEDFHPCNYPPVRL